MSEREDTNMNTANEIETENVAVARQEEESVVDTVIKNTFKTLSEDTISYLQDRRVAEIMEFLLRTIVMEKPQDPYAFIHRLTSTPYRPRIVITGPPGTYVDTHCEQIIEFYRKKNKLRPVYICCGELIRSKIQGGDVNARITADFIEHSNSVPDAIVFDYIRERLQQSDAKENGWILDGFPRNKNQVQKLDEEGLTPDLFIQLVADEKVILERIEWQRLDPVTEVLYHLKFNPPPKEDVSLMERLIQRPEDTRESVLEHIEKHRTAVAILAEAYSRIRVCQNANLPLIDALKETDETLEKNYIA